MPQSLFVVFSPLSIFPFLLVVTCSSGRSHPAPVTTFPLLQAVFSSCFHLQSTNTFTTQRRRRHPPPVITPSKYGLPASFAAFDFAFPASFSSPADEYATGNAAQASTPRHHQGRTSTREADIVNTSPSGKRRTVDSKAIPAAIGTISPIQSFTSAAPPPLFCFAAFSKSTFDLCFSTAKTVVMGICSSQCCGGMFLICPYD